MKGSSIIRPRLLAMSAALLLSMAGASPAYGSVGETIILRCTHAESLSGFSQHAYAEALRDLSAVAEEYSECANLIRQAQLAAALGGGAGRSSVVPILPTPAEQRSIEHALRAGSAPVAVGSELVHPGVVRANVSSALSTMPTPLLAFICLLLACLLAAAGGALRHRLRADRPG